MSVPRATKQTYIKGTLDTALVSAWEKVYFWKKVKKIIEIYNQWVYS